MATITLAVLVSAYLRRQGQGSFDGPSSRKAGVQRCVRRSYLSRPILKHHTLSVQLKPAIASRVVHLLGARGPSAVFAAVWTVIVNAIKAVLWTRATAHVTQERFERHPFIAHGDSSATIVAIGIVSLVRATGLHRKPVFLFLRCTHAMRALHKVIVPQGAF